MSRVRRAMLFMPGDSHKKIEKGTTLGVDSIIMDLEDGVAFTQKAEARRVIREAIPALDFGRSERLIRINPVGSALEMDDLADTIAAHPDGYVIPKVDDATQVIQVSDWLAQAEQERGWQMGGIALFALIETARGVVNLKEIAQSSQRLAGLMFGAEDFASSIGAIRTVQGMEVFYARSAVVTYAKAFNLQAIDSPYVDIHNLDGLREETRQIMHMGYDGKLAIHPKHVSIIEEVFTPPAETVERARALITAHDEHQRGGTGVFTFEGRMIDMPMIRAAEQVLARAGSHE